MRILSKKEVVSPALLMLSCHAEEKNRGNLSGTGFVQRFLSVDAIMPGSVRATLLRLTAASLPLPLKTSVRRA